MANMVAAIKASMSAATCWFASHYKNGLSQGELSRGVQGRSIAEQEGLKPLIYSASSAVPTKFRC